MKKILVHRIDGGVSIITPTNEATPKRLLEIALAVPGYLSHDEVEDEDIPEDRSFRDAWVGNKNKIDVCPDKSRELIREARNRELKKLDLLAFAASRKKDPEELAVIDEEAQRLRDITKTDNFNSKKIEDLKACLGDCKADLTSKPKEGA